MGRRRSIAPIRLNTGDSGGSEVRRALREGQGYRWDFGKRPSLLLLELITGHDHFGLAFGGNDKRRREVWEDEKGAILSAHVEARPGTRPWAWWEYDAPEPRRLADGKARHPSTAELWFGVPDPRGAEKYESQAHYLSRLGLLAPNEDVSEVPEIEIAHPAEKYAQDVLKSAGNRAHDPENGEYVTGKPVQWACQRHLEDLKEARKRGFFFSHRLADRRHQFWRFLRHFKGRWQGQVYVPETWQIFVYGTFFGWVDDRFRRRFYESWVRCARKQGKSMDAMGDAWYLGTADQEGAPEVYITGPSKQQSKKFFQTIEKFYEQAPIFRQIATWKAQEYEYQLIDGGLIGPMSKDHNIKDGFSPHCAVFEEVHAYPDGHLVNVFSSGMDAREQPALLNRTTPGFDAESYAARKDADMLDILNPETAAANDRAHIYIAALDQEDLKDIDEKPPPRWAWPKCRPNQGVTSTDRSVQREIDRNIGRRDEWLKTVVKTFGVWMGSGEAGFINMVRWRGCVRGNEGALAWRERELAELSGGVFLGLDLGRSDDPAALALWHPERRVLIPWYWIPGQDLDQRVEDSGVPYDRWVEEGLIETVKGPVVEDQPIKDRLRWISERCSILGIGVDSHEASQIMPWIRLEIVPPDWALFIDQGHSGLHEAGIQLEAMVKNQNFDHGGNPVLAWNARNCQPKTDSKSRIIPQKRAAAQKIDGIAATLDALAAELKLGHIQGETGVFF